MCIRDRLRLFELQAEQGFWLSLKWVPSAANQAADAITRPPMHEILRLRPEAFQQLERWFGPFTVDLMASSENAQHGRDPHTGKRRRLTFYSRYNCEGSDGVDVFQQDVALTPGQGTPAFGYCFPPPVMVGHIVHHLADCHARAVVVLPDLNEYWAPRVTHAAVKELKLPQTGTFSFPHHRDGVREFVYARHGMRAVELDFSVGV